jgi:hypothetical protein
MLKYSNNSGLMETGEDQKNGITFKNLADLVRMQMIFIDRLDILSFQV